AEYAAYRAKKHAFDQKLANDTPARGSKCCANRHFALTADGAAQHHVGDIGAGDEQNEADGSQHEQEDHAYIAAVVVLMEGFDDDADVLVRVGILNGEAAGV